MLKLADGDFGVAVRASNARTSRGMAKALQIFKESGVKGTHSGKRNERTTSERQKAELEKAEQERRIALEKAENERVASEERLKRRSRGRRRESC